MPLPVPPERQWQKRGKEQAREPPPGKHTQEQAYAQHLRPSHIEKPHHVGPDMCSTELCFPIKDFSLACCLSLQSHISSLDFLSPCMQSLSSCRYLPQLCQCPWQPNTVSCAQVCVSRAGLVKIPPLPPLSVSCTQKLNSLRASLIHVLGPVSSSMSSYQNVTQLVLLLVAAPHCHNVTDEQKALNRRKRIERK